jgi:hypothetical protein
MKLDCYYDYNQWQVNELLSNLVFEVYIVTHSWRLSGPRIFENCFVYWKNASIGKW